MIVLILIGWVYSMSIKFEVANVNEGHAGSSTKICGFILMTCWEKFASTARDGVTERIKCVSGPFKKGSTYTIWWYSGGPDHSKCVWSNRADEIFLEHRGSTDGVAITRVRTTGFSNNMDKSTWIVYDSDDTLSKTPKSCSNRAYPIGSKNCGYFWIDSGDSKCDTTVALDKSLYGYGSKDKLEDKHDYWVDKISGPYNSKIVV